MLAAAALLLATMKPDDFSRRLWGAMPTDRGNVVVSPTSLNACLGLLIRAVGPSSRPALAKTLGVAPAELEAYEAALQERLRAVTSGDEATVASAGFFAAPPAPAYVAAVAKGFGATAERLKAGDAGLGQVNAWADARTKGRIPRLLEGLPPRTPAVFLNAVTFDGLWETPFSPGNTSKAAFAAPSGSRPVDTMHMKTARLSYAKGAGFQAIALPYQGGRYRMLILLPDAGDPGALLRGDAWRSAVDGASEATVDLALPRFTVRSEPNVEAGLKAMGLAPLFSKVDLRPAVPSGAVDRIGAVVQKTFIEVGEKGTKAAAATGIVMTRAIMRPIPSIRFHVDRPFAFVLQHVGSFEPLFEGVVREP